MGHVRDLPQSAKDIPAKFKNEPWAKLGVNVEKGFEPIYCVPRNKTKVISHLKDLLKDADELILATDEDREGESISWHLLELLKPKVPVKRMVFHEITKEAIQKSLTEFRDIDMDLVRAQEARRILDRLVGYTLSPLIWKKIAYGLSAGRVQSVAVRLISEREQERLEFIEAQYAGVTGALKAHGVKFDARAFTIHQKRVATGKDFDPKSGKLLDNKKDSVHHLLPPEAQKIAASVEGRSWEVAEVEEKPIFKKPAPPFITSTLQQEANRKLGLGARETMQVAQSLYEKGFITYMRTDSTFLSAQALEAARARIQERYGKEYLPEKVRTYQGKKVKGAQEAHEAIRPAGQEMTPPEETKLKGVNLALYELIWKRALASQMVDSRQKQVSAKFHVDDFVFSASGTTIEFPGFLKVYVESLDESDADPVQDAQLPKLKVGETVECLKAQVTEHQTKPPARYTEASLVQKLEQDGIGRPSTYASILGTIQDRGYVMKQGNALVPTFTAMVVSNLLSEYLPKYVDSGFTSEMEQSLDEIASGDLVSTDYLKSFFSSEDGLQNAVEAAAERINPEKARSITLPKPSLQEFSFRVGKYGAYVCRDEEGEEVCASLPDAQPPADVTADVVNKLIDQKIHGTDSLGKHPETQEPIYVLSGRYGPYVQMGDVTEEDAKPKRTSIPKGFDPDELTFEEAVFLVDLPKTLGEHPSTGKEIKIGIGRFGPFVVCDGDFRSIKAGTDLRSVTLEDALALLAQPKRGRGRAAPIQELGEHPDTKEPIQVLSGRYGPYVKCGKVNVSLPEDKEPDKITREEALKLLADKAPVKKTKTKKKAAAKKTKKTAAKKATKSAAKKTAAKKTAKKTPAASTKTVKKKTAVGARKASGAGGEELSKPGLS